MIEYEYEFSIPVCRPYIIASLIPILSLKLPSLLVNKTKK